MTTPYSIGYCSTSEAHDAGLPEARIQNRANRFLGPNVDGVQSAMDSFADSMGAQLTGLISDSSAPDAYPIAGYTYFVVRKKSMVNCTVATEMFRYNT